MSIWIVFIAYTFISATGLFFIKTGADSTNLAFQNGLFSMQLSPRLLIGITLYLVSFLVSIYIMSRIKLSLFYPMGTGAILILTCLSGYFLLKEHIGIWQLVGIGLILAGIVAMNIETA